jgi:menaquinone-dependent protoporphyrinogen IX oxidase
LCQEELTVYPPKSISIFKDPVLESTPKALKDMSIWEKSHAISYYLTNIKKVAPEFSPSALAFFKGNLDFSKLSFFHRMVMKFITLINKEVKEGDYLSEEALQNWAASQLSSIILKEQ